MGAARRVAFAGGVVGGRAAAAFDVPRAAYIHIPFCRQRCGYCDFPIQVIGRKQGAGQSRFQEYTDTVVREIRAMYTGSENQQHQQLLNSVYFGGGTPSLLPPECLEQILREVRTTFGYAEDAEITLEMDPGTFDVEKASAFKQLGVNRASVGAQSFDQNLLENCGRTHTVQDIYEAVDDLRSAQLQDFSLDLISGLPDQTLGMWENSLRSALALDPTHISCYDLVVENDTRFGKLYKPGEAPLPSEDNAARMYRAAVHHLTGVGGFTHYEVSNFAKTTATKSVHNQAYWNNRSYLGFGLGATSYAGGKRVSRPRTYSKYAQWVRDFESQKNPSAFHDSPTVSRQDKLEDTVMLGLRLVDGLSIEKIRQEFGAPVVKQLCQSLSAFPEFVTMTDTAAKLKDPNGFLFSNTVLSAVLAQVSVD